jgi:hypothetical protein
MVDNDIYFCYSKRLSYFLRAFISYEDTGLNKNTNTKYYTFKKGERLDNLIKHIMKSSTFYNCKNNNSR